MTPKTRLSGKVIADAIDWKQAQTFASGATISAGQALAADTISEVTSAAGVTVDGVVLKDSGVSADTISEKTTNAGVTVDGALIKDTAIRARNTTLAVTADGAITVPTGNISHYITKAGVAAMTIADPTATTHDGVQLRFVAATANAHTLSNAAGSGFFSSGGATKDVATFGGAIGDRITIEAYQGKWYIVDSLNITLG